MKKTTFAIAARNKTKGKLIVVDFSISLTLCLRSKSNEIEMFIHFFVESND